MNALLWFFNVLEGKMEISVHESCYALPYRFCSVALALGSQRLVGTGPFQ